MTTSRPYRKALPLEEALRRIEDAAGTQLDEQLVIAFLEGMRNAPACAAPGGPGSHLRPLGAAPAGGLTTDAPPRRSAIGQFYHHPIAVAWLAGAGSGARAPCRSAGR